MSESHNEKWRLALIAAPDYEPALDLVRRVFLEFEAPDYTQEGVNFFLRQVLDNRDYLKLLTMYGAYSREDGRLLGVMATRSQGRHLALLFVERAAQGQGLGRALFRLAWEQAAADRLTVNSSPYAVDIYRHWGFSVTGPERTEDGIRSTPMVFIPHSK